MVPGQIPIHAHGPIRADCHECAWAYQGSCGQEHDEGDDQRLQHQDPQGQELLVLDQQGQSDQIAAHTHRRTGLDRVKRGAAREGRDDVGRDVGGMVPVQRGGRGLGSSDMSRDVWHRQGCCGSDAGIL